MCLNACEWSRSAAAVYTAFVLLCATVVNMTQHVKRVYDGLNDQVGGKTAHIPQYEVKREST